MGFWCLLFNIHFNNTASIIVCQVSFWHFFIRYFVSFQLLSRKWYTFLSIFGYVLLKMLFLFQEVNRSDRTYCLVPCWLLFYALLPSEKEKSIILCCVKLVFKQIARLYFKQSAKCFDIFPRNRLSLSEFLQSRLAQQLFILDAKL